MPTSDSSDAFNRVLQQSGDEVLFDDVFPSETRGGGKLASNNLRTGAAQGRSNLIRKAACQQCGFPADQTKVDHSGGSIDGSGAVGSITPHAQTVVLPNGTPVAYRWGEANYRTNSGCPLCSSKNSTSLRQDVTNLSPWDRTAPLGF